MKRLLLCLAVLFSLNSVAIQGMSDDSPSDMPELLGKVLLDQARLLGIRAQEEDFQTFIDSMGARYAQARRGLIDLMNSVRKRLEHDNLTSAQRKELWARLEAQCVILSSMEDLFIPTTDKLAEELQTDARIEFEEAVTLHLVCRCLHQLHGGPIIPTHVLGHRERIVMDETSVCVHSLSPVFIPLPIEAVIKTLRSAEEYGELTFESGDARQRFWNHLDSIRQGANGT